MSDNLVKRLREGTNGTDVTKTDAVLTAYMHEAADRIEQLAATNEELERLVNDAPSVNLAYAEELQDAEARIEELETKLAKLTKAATKVHTSYWYSTDGGITGMYELEQALRIGELKGETDGR